MTKWYPQPPLPEVMARYTEKRPDGCWIWTGRVHSAGYGAINDGKKSMCTHRVAWQLIHGWGLPRDLFVCHKCDVRLCVNPGHLFLGTQKDNMRDCVQKGRLKINLPNYVRHQLKISLRRVQ